MSRDDVSVLQFGAGKFLRSFLDLFVEEARREGQDVGRILIAQSTPGERARLLEQQGRTWQVLVRGIEDGQRVDRVERVTSVARAVRCAESWGLLREAICSPDLRAVFSNTTERGYSMAGASMEDAELEAGKRAAGSVEGGRVDAPRSFPARLTALLLDRFRAGLPGLSILPCELLPNNANLLRSRVLEVAREWRLEDDFAEWIEGSCRWHVNLVDRIVAEPPADHPLRAEDPLLTACEPFASLAVAGDFDLFEHPAIQPVDDVSPWALRKVRILNGAHTALVARALPAGFETVREAVEDRQIGSWLRSLLSEEIVPTIEERVTGAEAFAETCIERFLNPYLEHRLRDIALYHEDKVAMRLEPTRVEYRQRFQREPPLLAELLSSATRPV